MSPWKSAADWAREYYLDHPETYMALAAPFRAAMRQVQTRLLELLGRAPHEWKKFPPPCERAVIRALDMDTGEVDL